MLESRALLTGLLTAIVDTGQTASYNNSSVIVAPLPGADFYGQDAQFARNQPSYTLGADGLTVYDNHTELTWTRSPDLNRDGTINIQDKLSFADALAYPAVLNAERYGGYDDWRLPSIKELYSLMDFRGVDPSGYSGTSTVGLIPFIDTDFFEFAYGDTRAGERLIDAQFWSSTVYVERVFGNQSAAFGLNLADGRIKGYPSGSTGPLVKFEYVYFVRGDGDYGTNRFVDSRDGTITDQATGLMWSQADSGTGMNWEAALAWAQQKNAENYLGHNDWRLPNAKELQSIVDYTRSPSTTGSAAIDPVFQTTPIINEAGQADYPAFWSSTTHANWTATPGQNAAYVNFGRSMGYMNGSWMDVHGAGAQRSDPKAGNPDDWPTGHGPQGDAIRIDNFVRLVRDADSEPARLSVLLAVASVSEAAGSAATLATISRNTDTSAALTVTLASSDTSEATVPPTVTIPAGQPSVTVNVAAVDDDNVDGTQSVTITASAPDFLDGDDTLQVTDDDVANGSPTLVHPIADQDAQANRPFHFTFARETFVDPDAGQSLRYVASQADGSPLPRWMRFDGPTRTFSGRPLVRDVGSTYVRITAIDSGSPSLAATTHFTIHVTPHPARFQNADQPHDVDGTGQVTPRDVLIVIHWLNNQGARPVPDSVPELPDGSLSFVDVNGDDLVSAADALTVVNHLNRLPAVPLTLSQEKRADSTAPRNTAVTQRSSLDAPASRDTAAVDDVFRTAADSLAFDRWEDILAPSAGSKMRRS